MHAIVCAPLWLKIRQCDYRKLKMMDDAVVVLQDFSLQMIETINGHP